MAEGGPPLVVGAGQRQALELLGRQGTLWGLAGQDELLCARADPGPTWGLPENGQAEPSAGGGAPA